MDRERWSWGLKGRPTTPLHTHYRQQKKRKTGTLECKENESNAKKCGFEKCKQKQKT